MPVIDITRDLDALALAVSAEYDAPVERCWQLWADPRQLERWWGPPVYPATFVTHDLTPGAFCTYFMTGPEGDRPHGWWRVLVVDPPHSLEVEDGFGDDPGNAGDLPLMRMRVVLAEGDGGGTLMTVTSTFASLAAMQQVLEMGMEEGIREAAGQIDAILAGG
jgi:uncharacterized protein YndB with AHSA1/START domain